MKHLHGDMKKTGYRVSFIHREGIMHRDLKPDNVLLDDSCFPYKLKICDFGSAKEFSSMNNPYV